MFLCSLVGLEMELQSMLILIMLEISIRGGPLHDTYSPLEVVLLVGKLLFSLQYLCQLQRQGTWQLQKLVKKTFG